MPDNPEKAGKEIFVPGMRGNTIVRFTLDSQNKHKLSNNQLFFASL
jgi:hypothetical protein